MTEPGRRVPKHDMKSGSRGAAPRTERYLIAPAPRHDLFPFTEPLGENVVDRLREDPDVRIIRTIRPIERPGRLLPLIVVAELTPTHAARLATTPGLTVESDQPLRHGTAPIAVTDPGVTPYDEPVQLTIRVEDADGSPLHRAAVHVIADHASPAALTDENGRATTTVARNEIEAVTGVYVQPQNDHWNVWLERPRLSATELNQVVCNKLIRSSVDSWSRRAMGFDRVPPTYRGHGVKIAIVDSGVAMTHTDLAERVAAGRDIVADDDKGWQDDNIGYGTLAVGLIAATDTRGRVTGLAPEAEVHVFKVFPGGHTSDLFEALDHCIAAQVDVVALGVGTSQPSWLLARKIEEGRQAGTACVAAAGSNAGPVSFPAALPTVLAVGAIGQLGTFPPDSYHRTQFTSAPSPEGYFAARYSAIGPQIDLCAPGVAVVSTLPPDGLGALDGTAAAVPHVAALAALVLAHHPDFRAVFHMRTAARVDRLFDILRASCQPLRFIDPLRVGLGLPDAATAVGLFPGAAGPPWRYGIPSTIPTG
jgi:subtilisin family serine protease